MKLVRSRDLHRVQSGDSGSAGLPDSEAGFSRTDLFAGMAGMAVLFLALVPALGQAAAKASKVRCIDNLAQIGRAFRSYALDRDRRFPMEITSNSGGSRDYLRPDDKTGANATFRHFWVLSNELGRTSLLVCPSDTGRYVATNFADLGSNSTRSRNAAISYGVGTGAMESNPRMILAGDRALNWLGGPVALQFHGLLAARGNIGTNSESLRTLEWESRGMHADGGNLLRVDGSVMMTDSARMRRAFSESGDAKNNYSQPGKSSN